jgi:glucose/arabinose dehydrogenase
MRTPVFVLVVMCISAVADAQSTAATTTTTTAAAAKETPYAPLPAMPPGWSVRQVAAMPHHPVRVIGDDRGASLYVLCLSGDLYRIALPNGPPIRVLEVAKYAPRAPGGAQFLGIALDRGGRLYIVGNRFDLDFVPQMNHTTVYRTGEPVRDGQPIDPKPWVTADIPFAIDVFQHSVGSIAQGPDGFMYVSSGSRTDHGEAGNDPKRSKEGETDLSACIWRLDPKQEHPQIEVFARGLRNAFGFCWDGQGDMYATENGPNANPPEEVNLIAKGRHYGFPFQFADWDHKAYPDQPSASPGLKIEPPLAKLDPHSSPSGIVYYQGMLLVARFGNLVSLSRDVGFDIVQVDPASGEVKPFLAPIARPTDMQLARNGKIYVCEYSRQLHNSGPEDPGRILEISPAR